jgi:hypothetical protein
MVAHARTVQTAAARDGDFDAVVVRVPKTGLNATVQGDRYKHAITHGLGRVPVGCQIVMKDKACDVYVISSTAATITVRFTTSGADVTLRIW